MDFRRKILPSSVLHWNYRGFTEFPIHRISGEESEITDIYLKENLISKLPTEISKLHNLESLYLSGNDITELPAEISNLKCLKCLDVSGNRLRRLPGEIGDLRALKFLIADENELEELPLRMSEVRGLRYLSICDNRLRWLPQRPVYNYYHCELRFWRNSSLRSMPYYLWYHMFRGQQTRSLNIGCLSIPQHQQTGPDDTYRLKLGNGSKEWEIGIQIPPHYNNILEDNKVPSLYELCRRLIYQNIYDAAKTLSLSLISGNCYWSTEINNNVPAVNYENFKINNNNLDFNGNSRNGIINFNHNLCNEYKRKDYYAPVDVIEAHLNFLPKFMKRDLKMGPVSRCENVSCRSPIFDYAIFEFCLEKLILIDDTQEVILSSAFCCKRCADIWKAGKGNIIPRTFVLNDCGR